nr:hypothetical protein [uncultured Methanobrevibacter sp.]
MSDFFYRDYIQHLKYNENCKWLPLMLILYYPKKHILNHTTIGNDYMESINETSKEKLLETIETLKEENEKNKR